MGLIQEMTVVVKAEKLSLTLQFTALLAHLLLLRFSLVSSTFRPSKLLRPTADSVGVKHYPQQRKAKSQSTKPTVQRQTHTARCIQWC